MENRTLHLTIAEKDLAALQTERKLALGAGD